MRKMVLGLCMAIVLVVGGGVLCADVITIDSSRILRESREGRSILALNEKDKKEAMDFEYAQSKKIEGLRDDIEKGIREGKLSEGALQDKYENLGRAQRSAKHKIDDYREDVGYKEKKRIIAFRKKIQEMAGKVFKGHVVFDKASPGMIVATNDKTDDFIKEANEVYKKEKATLMLTKAAAKGDKKKA